MREKQVAYIKLMLMELNKMADDAEAPVLSYFIDMAVSEARNLERKAKALRQKREQPPITSIVEI